MPPPPAPSRYASRARNIKNKPKINTTPQDLRVAQMQTEIAALREQLESKSPDIELVRELSALSDGVATMLPGLRTFLPPEALRKLEELLARSRPGSRIDTARPVSKRGGGVDDNHADGAAVEMGAATADCGYQAGVKAAAVAAVAAADGGAPGHFTWGTFPGPPLPPATTTATVTQSSVSGTLLTQAGNEAIRALETQLNKAQASLREDELLFLKKMAEIERLSRENSRLRVAMSARAGGSGGFVSGSGSGSESNNGNGDGGGGAGGVRIGVDGKQRAQTAFPLGRDGWHQPFTLGGRRPESSHGSNGGGGGADVAKIAFGAMHGSAALLVADAGGVSSGGGGIVCGVSEEVEKIVAAEEDDDLVLVDSGSDDELTGPGSSRLYGNYHDSDQYVKAVSGGAGIGAGAEVGVVGIDAAAGGQQLWSEDQIEGEVNKLVNQALLERDRVAIAALTTERTNMESFRQSVQVVMQSTTQGTSTLAAALATAANTAVGQSVQLELEQLRAEHARLQQEQYSQVHQQRVSSEGGGGQDLNASMERHLVEISEQIGVMEVGDFIFMIHSSTCVELSMVNVLGSAVYRICCPQLEHATRGCPSLLYTKCRVCLPAFVPAWIFNDCPIPIVLRVPQSCVRSLALRLPGSLPMLSSFFSEFSSLACLVACDVVAAIVCFNPRVAP